MIIEEKISCDKTTYNEILTGNAFEYCHHKFIKTEISGEAVDLRTGEIVNFNDQSIVVKTNAKVVIE